MRSLSYRAFYDEHNTPYNNCSREVTDKPLVVNCAGNFSVNRRFATDNVEGRLDFYLLYVHTGRLTVSLPCGDKVCTSGDFIIYPPRQRYRYSHEREDELDYFWVHFTGADVESLLSEYDLLTYPSINSTKDDGGVAMRFATMFDAFAKQDRFRDKEISLLLERLLISLARRTNGSGDVDANQLKRSLSYINSSYNTDIRIPTLAAMENLSVSRYNAVFKKLMGVSPTEYIIKMRISSASELLIGTDLPIKEIARLVGYADPHFFSRVFKSHKSVSPAEYRKFI